MSNIKTSIIYLARITGLIRLILFLFRRRIVIFMLHGVMDSNSKESHWQPTWARTSRLELEGAIKRLNQYCNFVSMDEAVLMINGQTPLKPNSVVITFDDGYSNNISHALPILEKYNASFIIYIATRYVRERVAFWVDDIDYALNCLVGEHGVEVKLGQIPYTFHLQDRTTYKSSYARFRKHLKAMQFRDDYEMLSAVESVAQQLNERAGRSISDILEEDPWSRPLSTQELKRVNGITTIGAHTESHIRVTKVDLHSLQKELLEPKSELESITNRECNHFCYPSGDFNDNTAQQVAKAAYLSAVTSVEGTNTIGSDLFQLRRFSFPHLSKPSDADFWLAKELLREWAFAKYK